MESMISRTLHNVPRWCLARGARGISDRGDTTHKEVTLGSPGCVSNSLAKLEQRSSRFSDVGSLAGCDRPRMTMTTHQRLVEVRHKGRTAPSRRSSRPDFALPLDVATEGSARTFARRHDPAALCLVNFHPRLYSPSRSMIRRLETTMFNCFPKFYDPGR
jgi:hypothetical protein